MYLGQLPLHLLRKSDPAAVPEAQLPVEAPAEGPDLPGGCGQDAEVPGSCYGSHHLTLNPCHTCLPVSINMTFMVSIHEYVSACLHDLEL